MKRNNNNKKHVVSRKKNKECTFVLGLPLVFNRGSVGKVVKEFTDIGLKLIDLRCMSVTREFMEAFLRKKQKKGRGVFTGPVMELVTRGPFLAMKLQGGNAVNRAIERVSLTSKFPKNPLWDYWPLVYCSDTVESAQEDAAMWFCADSESPDKEIMKKNNLFFRLYDGSICNGTMEKLLDEEIIEMKIKIDFDLERANQRFVLIKPKAVREGIMPELLAKIDHLRCYVKGLKLVKESEVPCSVAWSDGCSSLDATRKKGEFGIALIVCPPNSAFDEQGSLLLGVDTTSDFVFVSEKGESLKFAKEFFKFGLVGWVDQASKVFCGGKFEPTLTGLLY